MEDKKEKSDSKQKKSSVAAKLKVKDGSWKMDAVTFATKGCLMNAD